MNQGRIWTVVKPTVGLPLFIGSVAVTSLLLHYAILTHTTWYPSYWQGGHYRDKTSMTAPAPDAPALAALNAKSSSQ